MQTQLHTERDRRMTSITRRKEVIVPPGLFNLLSALRRAGITVVATLPSANTEVHSPGRLSVVFSSAVARLGGRAEQAQNAGTAQLQALQLEPVKGDPFPHKRRTSSVTSCETAASAIAEASESLSRESSNGTSEASIPLATKEMKRGGRPKKE